MSVKFSFSIILLLVTIWADQSISAQPLAESNPFYLGHSLVNFDMPAMVHALAIDAGKTTTYDQQIINGAPLWWNFENYEGCQGTAYVDAFPGGGHDAFIVTEAVPLVNHLTWSGTYENASNFMEYAMNHNDGQQVRFFIYETWHCTNTGIHPPGCDYDENDDLLWHPRLLEDLPLWTGIVDHVRNDFPDEDVWMVPAGQALYNLTTEINAGNIPDISSFTDLFSDDIHLNNAGNYFVACVMYACIFRDNPMGLTSSIGSYTNMPSEAQASAMQAIAWNTVLEHSEWSGVTMSLQVEVAHFQAEKSREHARIHWVLEEAESLKSLELQHSTDGIHFRPIHEISRITVGDLRSHFVHTLPAPGDNYYRLKLTEEDLTATYTHISLVRFQNSQWSFYPNPGDRQLFFPDSTKPFQSITIKDLYGRTVLSSGHVTTLDISRVIPGSYLISITDGVDMHTEKLVVRR